MKALTTATAAGIGAILLAFTPASDTQQLTISPEASKVEWFAEKVTGKHNGLVKLKEGWLEIKDKKIVGGQFKIDMTSIVVSDLDGEYKGKLEGHLKSPDFFDIEQHPTSTLKIKRVTEKVDGAFNRLIVGDLTIKGITHEVSFPAKVSMENNTLAAYGELVIDRSKYEVRYGSKSFFDNLGDKAIYDEFTMKVSIGAKM